MYIVFCGMVLTGKQQYQDFSTAYMLTEKCIPLEHMMIVSDPTSSDLGRAIVPLDRQKQHFNNTESGLLYLAASLNIYDRFIVPALRSRQHIVCKGCFTEVLGYQGSTLEDQGISWPLLKSVYADMAKTAHQTIRYPDLIVFCVSAFEQAQVRALAFQSTSWEAQLSRADYEKYSRKMRKAYELISGDAEFTKNTKLMLADEVGTTAEKVWERKIRPELDRLLSEDSR